MPTLFRHAEHPAMYDPMGFEETVVCNSAQTIDTAIIEFNRQVVAIDREGNVPGIPGLSEPAR